MNSAHPDPVAYEALAHEYYDATRHPTCANFRDASARVAVPWLRRFCTFDARIGEVGAGKSVLLEFLNRERRDAAEVVVTDASPAMLQYSAHMATPRARLLVAPAWQLPLSDTDATLVFSSLGDPYNTENFWREAWRVLRPGGHVIFTTPSHEWATAFRRNADALVAEFEVSGSRKVHVPSFILDVDDQLDLTRGCGFSTRAVHELSLDDLNSRNISPKLVLPELGTAPIVKGYLLRKR